MTPVDLTFDQLRAEYPLHQVPRPATSADVLHAQTQLQLQQLLATTWRPTGNLC